MSNVRWTARVLATLLLVGLSVSTVERASASNWVIADPGDVAVHIVADEQVVHTVSSILLSDGSGVGRGSIFDVAVNNTLGIAYAAIEQGEPVPEGYVPIVIIDMASGKATARVADPLGLIGQQIGFIYTLAASADGLRVYFWLNFPNLFGVIDTATNQVIGTLPLPGGASAIEIAADGSKAYLGTSIPSSENLGGYDAAIYVVDLASLSIESALHVAPEHSIAANPAQLRLTNDGQKIYVISTAYAPPYTRRISVVDLTTSVASSVGDPNGDIHLPEGLATAGSKVYVSNRFQASGNCSNGPWGNVLVIDVATNAIVNTIPLPGDPTAGIGTDLAESQIYAANVVWADNCAPGQHSPIEIIDVASDTIVGAIDDPKIKYAKSAVDPFLPHLTPVRCTASKRKAAGIAIKKELSCHAKALSKNALIDARCLQKADAQLSAAFAKVQGLCTGEIATVQGLVANCIDGVLADVPSTGKCAGGSTNAAGKHAGAYLGCASKDATTPGVLSPCTAKLAPKLPAALVRAGSCAHASLPADLNGCVAAVRDALPR